MDCSHRQLIGAKREKVQNFFGITGEMLAMGHVATRCDILRAVTRVVSFRSDVYEIG